MHVISDKSLMRDNYSYEELPNGGWVGRPVDLTHRDNERPQKWKCFWDFIFSIGR